MSCQRLQKGSSKASINRSKIFLISKENTFLIPFASQLNTSSLKRFKDPILLGKSLSDYVQDELLDAVQYFGKNTSEERLMLVLGSLFYDKVISEVFTSSQDQKVIQRTNKILYLYSQETLKECLLDSAFRFLIQNFNDLRGQNDKTIDKLLDGHDNIKVGLDYLDQLAIQIESLEASSRSDLNQQGPHSAYQQ
eukprot:403358886